MHSLLPHEHHEEASASEDSLAYVEADGLMDYLKLMFHIDLGDGHMESFDQGKGLDFDVNFTFDIASENLLATNIQPFLNVGFDNRRITNFYSDDIPIVPQYFLSHIDFRGPPAIA